VVWWTKGAQPPQLLADREVAIASAYNGRLFSAIAEKKQPFAIMSSPVRRDMVDGTTTIVRASLSAPFSG